MGYWNETTRQWTKHPDCTCGQHPEDRRIASESVAWICICSNLRMLGAMGRPINANVTEIAKIVEKKMAAKNKRLLWGTANMFSNRRFMAGAATNPDPDVFAYCAAQVKHCLDVTKDLDGANYVMWGGREGYETLLNTNLKQEQDQLARFFHMAVDYKEKIGFKGTFLIEPKPKEPTKHQYDSDTAACLNFLREYDLLGDFKLNVRPTTRPSPATPCNTNWKSPSMRALSARLTPTPATCCSAGTPITSRPTST